MAESKRPNSWKRDLVFAAVECSNALDAGEVREEIRSAASNANGARKALADRALRSLAEVQEAVDASGEHQIICAPREGRRAQRSLTFLREAITWWRDYNDVQAPSRPAHRSRDPVSEFYTYANRLRDSEPDVSLNDLAKHLQWYAEHRATPKLRERLIGGILDTGEQVAKLRDRIRKAGK